MNEKKAEKKQLIKENVCELCGEVYDETTSGNGLGICKICYLKLKGKGNEKKASRKG